MSLRVVRPLLTVVAVALSLLPFLQLVQLGVDVVKLYAGLAAFAGLASLIPVAIAEIAFVVASGAILARGARRGRLAAAFLWLGGLELLALPAIELVRVALYWPLTRGDLPLHRALLRPAALPIAAAGLALGAPAVVAALFAGRRGRPPYRPDRGPASRAASTGTRKLG